MTVSEKKLLLAEHADQVLDFLRHGAGAGDTWIALGPSAMWCLDQRKLRYRIPEEFYTEQQLEELCLDAHQRLEALCHRLDSQIAETIPEIREWGIRPFLFEIWPLMRLTDSLIRRIFELRRVLLRYPQHAVCAHRSASLPWGAYRSFSNNETLYGHLLALPGWHHHIHLQDYSGKVISDGLSAVSAKKTALNLINRSFHARSIAHCLRNGSFLKQLRRLYQHGKPSIIINNGIYEWAGVISALQADGFRVFNATTDSFGRGRVKTTIKKGQRFIDQIINDPETMSLFEYEGISYWPVIRDRISWVFGMASDFPRIRRKVVRVFDTYAAKAILTSTQPDLLSHAVAQIARKMEIPVLNWQHGMVFLNGMITQSNHFNDLMTTDVALAYGSEVCKAYQKYTDTFPAAVFPVGSSRLDNLRLPRQNGNNYKPGYGEKPRVLYATSNYLQNTWYYGFKPPYSDRLFYRDQLAIFDFLKTMAERGRAAVTIKLYPIVSHPDPPWSDAEVGKNMRIIKQKPSFENLLFLHDVVLLDLPTTTLLQSIAAGRHVFVLLRHMHLPEEGVDLLRRRAVCAYEVNTLLNDLERYLSSGETPADLLDNAFLQAYGNHLDDGGSTRRAVSIIGDTLKLKAKHHRRSPGTMKS